MYLDIHNYKLELDIITRFQESNGLWSAVCLFVWSEFGFAYGDILVSSVIYIVPVVFLFPQETLLKHREKKTTALMLY